MALQLTTPIDVGMMDDQNYTHAKIVHIRMDLLRESLDFKVHAGYFSDNKWQSAKFNSSGKTAWAFSIEGAAYVEMMQTLPANTTENLYNQVARALYQWLIDNDHIQGTII